MDAAKNFAKSTLSTGYTSGVTSIVLTTGGGALFPAPSFNAVWYDATTYSSPADDPDREIVRVTNIATDTLTVVRAQEGTSDLNHNTGGKTYLLVAGPTAKLIADITSTFAAKATTLAGYNVTSPLDTGEGGTGTATTFTAGAIVFAGASGVYNQNNGNLFWDDTDGFLGVGTATPAYVLHVNSEANPSASQLNITANLAGALSFWCEG